MEREKMMIELELKENIQRHRIEQQETRQMLLQAEEKINGLQKKSERLREMQSSEYFSWHGFSYRSFSHVLHFVNKSQVL